VWGNNPDQDLALPTLERDKVIEDMIFDKLERWIWSLEHDVPPTMDKIPPTLALKSLANIYPRSDASLPTLEFPMKYEPDLRRMCVLQTEIGEYQEEIKIRTKEFEALSVRFAEIMKEHEKAVLETTSDKLLIDFATRVSNRTDTTALKKNHPLVYADVVKESLSRKMKVSVQPL
jgi:predicted phage-related endonuclease